VAAWKANIRVTLKKGVLDPQGNAVQRSLAALGYRGVGEVRVGKYLEVWLEAPDRGEAVREVEEMCRRLLANPVIEEFAFEVQEVRGAAAGSRP